MDISTNLLHWYIIYYKKSAAYTSGGRIKNDMANQQLKEQLHKPIRNYSLETKVGVQIQQI